MEVMLQERKRVLLLKDVRKWIAHAKKRMNQRTRDLAALLGKLNFVRLQHPPSSLWMKRMQYELRQAMARGGWKGTVIVSPMILGELTHKRKTLLENRPRCLRRRNRPAELTTDASELGWGAVLTIPTENKEEKIYVHGSWTLQESALAINEEEFRAVLRTLERKGAWLQQQKIDHIRLKTDNMSTRWAIQKRRGTPSLISTLRALEKKLNSLNITIQTEHLSGEQNTEADALRRIWKKPDYELKVEESRRDIANSRTENTRCNLRTDCASALRKYLETILREKEERERNTRRRHCTCPPVPEKHWTGAKRENERISEGSDDSDSASLAGADLDPATAAWAFDKEPGDLSGVHDTGSEDEKGRLETTPGRGDVRNTGEENIQGRDLFFSWGKYVGAKDIAAAILRNQKSERDTWRALRRFKRFLDRESMDDTELPHNQRCQMDYGRVCQNAFKY
ncbi:uncharacterized protein MONOS_9627 [Monocercomonoides exilis]|uniref:uncharacterized protein n=1 Tax=Monocercomonoides exilis TaxID=2049356 RepID=UPI003559788D|nr:hypothetical protein MONOS_9627 [Monocercomonoides exilis]|eukprot:MONOS_9627.1-p1 / transcript=MONOS_9627.1 / gene=MONOS_9627 / organism=Monocercomonoides_exilis_PA203 / gene_product=unspecified product / transcript_product=unspecified product / location=Mono_scaffold00403:56159-57520(+) / protein_length=454 / sequence_SO=supercontig / SO=protein_coding / is_pseudo=false